MELFVPLLVSGLVGAVLFGLNYLLNKRFKLSLMSGVFVISSVILFFFVMLFTFDPNNVYAGIGYTIMVVLSTAALFGYGLSWFVVKRLIKV
jgi:drug/metabolite transporter (DMT)-like permease